MVFGAMKPLQRRFALCVGINGDWCRLLYADDLSSVEYRPIFEEAVLGHWYCVVNNGGKTQIESSKDSTEKPKMTSEIEIVDKKPTIKLQVPIFLAPDFSKFGCKLKKTFDSSKFYSSIIEQGGQMKCPMPDWIEAGIQYEALVTLKIDEMSNGGDGLPHWSLDFVKNIIPKNQINSSYDEYREDGILLQIFPDGDAFSVAILCLCDGELAFGRILEQIFKIGDKISFNRFYLDCFSKPLRMALDIHKTEEAENSKALSLEALEDSNLFLLRFPMHHILELVSNVNNNGAIHVEGIGNLLDLNNIFCDKKLDIERARPNEVIQLCARLCLVPEQHFPLWLITKFVGIVPYHHDIGNENLNHFSDKCEQERDSVFPKRGQRIIPPADDLSEEHREIESETIKLEQEAVVVFTDIVCLELHMRFFEEKESKFTRYRCCRRRDLPSKYNTADPPAPGTWARITYTSTDDSYQHIAIQTLQDLEFESNLGAIIRYAKELVQPKNQKIWTALLNGSHRIITLQKLMEETKSPEETDSSGSEAEFEHFSISKNAQIEGQEEKDEEEAADVQLEDEETDDDNSVEQSNYSSGHEQHNQISQQQSTSSTYKVLIERPISNTADKREKQAIVLFTEYIGYELYLRFFDQHSGRFKQYCCCTTNNSFLSHLQQRPVPGLWAQINYQNITKTNKIMITNCKAIEDLPKTKFKTIVYSTMRIVRPEDAEIWNLFLKEKHRKWTAADLLSKLLEYYSTPGTPLSSCPPFPSCSTSKVSNSSVPLQSSTTFSSPLLCQQSKHFDSASQMCGIVVGFMAHLSSASFFVYKVWPFCTARSKPRLLFLDSLQQLPLGHWLKFDLRDYEVGRIRTENCSGMRPWLCTKTNSQNVFIECCITIPHDFGTAPEAEIWTYSWKNKSNEKVPFICKILPKSVDIENALKKSIGKRCIGRMMFEPYLDHTGVSRGYWSIDGYWAIDKKKH